MKNEKAKTAKVVVKKPAIKVAAKPVAKPVAKATKAVKVVAKPTPKAVVKKVVAAKSVAKVVKVPAQPAAAAPDRKQFLEMMKDTMTTVCSN
jgi:hypothetical protein